MNGKTLSEIIEAYKEDGHNIEGLFLMDVQRLDGEEIMDILLGANGRDIVVVYPEDENIMDGLDWGYSGQEDPHFDWDKYWQ